jgi:hypothetical protein
MSSRKAKRGKRRKRKARNAAHRLSTEDIERIRLSLLGVVATCGLVRSSFAASRCTGIVLTRGALQPIRETLTLLGEKDPEFSMAEYHRSHISRERRPLSR